MKSLMTALLLLSSVSVFADVTCKSAKNTVMIFNAEEGQLLVNYKEGSKLNEGADGQILASIITDNTVALNVNFDGLVFEVAASKVAPNKFVGKLVKIKNAFTTIETVTCIASNL